MTAPNVHGFFDHETFTVSYVVEDAATGRAAIIDPVLGYDPDSGRTNSKFAMRLIAFVRSKQLSIDWILETHVHADHLSAAPLLKATLGGQTGIGAGVVEVQDTFRRIFNLDDVAPGGAQFDQLFADEECFPVGDLNCRVLHTPGHTPACVTYVIGDAAFVGDTLFMPDFGTARTDFPGGSAGELYDSIQRILSLPGATRLFMCHDYKAEGRDEFAWETTVAEQASRNIHVGSGVTRDEFIELRQSRDAGLAMPRLILPSLQVNIRAGELPAAEANGIRYLKTPLDVL